MAEEIDKYEDDIDKLIDTGKEKGYLTYGEVNDLLPGDITTPDDLDDLLTTINTQGIDVLSGKSAPVAATSTNLRPAKSPTT
ncbi:RNA polymerase sigma factor region1.1 domain-containing protein [Tunturiibacter empetritectus]|uniref:RNA polymerase sigma factor region1.1 domain-containing protein n=1 Tax=Tunturiibacter empetritectus TaxID=3069691 RepID=UPI003D9AB943